MAKQLGVIQYSGKLGETVGAKKAAGQRSNVIRVRTAAISNPRSTAQAAQRMKMAPAVNFYRALRDILNHSWQGVTYGGASHSKFMKEAMRAPIYPYIPKGTTAAVPAPYKISIGSLSPVSVSIGSGDLGFLAITSIRLPDVADLGAYNTLGQLSKAIIDNNPQIQDGDQLTFISAIMSDVADVLDSGAMYRYSRFVIDTKNTDAMPTSEVYTDERDYYNINGVHLGMYDESMLAFTHITLDENFDSYFEAGAAVIISRPSITKGNVTWERSSQSLVVASTVLTYLTRAERYDECLETYKNSYSASSDWFLNGGNNSGSATPSQGQATVTVNVSESFANSVDVSGGGTFNIGDVVTVSTELKNTVQNPQNYAFMGWYKNGEQVSTNKNYQFVLEGNVELTASWTSEEQP